MGELEGGGGGDGGLYLKGVEKHQDHRENVGQAQDRQGHNPDDIKGLLSVFITAAPPWSGCLADMEMATTRRQKITAFAWPMPIHWGPVRP